MPPDLPDVLAHILADTHAETEERKRRRSEQALRDEIAAAGPTRGFSAALTDRAAAGRYALIGEIKKASPSGGLIRADFDPAALACAYEEGGATCLSVLTEGSYFQGRPEHLASARTASNLPVLRKDFILDPWQVYESRALGADCILLIMAALSDGQARELEELARSLDMDVLPEVHDSGELERALGLESRVIGINNRNLRTLETDVATTFALAPQVPPDRFIVAESGLGSPADLARLRKAGVLAFLVGEHLLRQKDVAAAVRTLLAEAP